MPVRSDSVRLYYSLNFHGMGVREITLSVSREEGAIMAWRREVRAAAVWMRGVAL